MIFLFIFMTVMVIYTSSLMYNVAVSNSNAVMEDRILTVSSMINNHLNTAENVLHVAGDSVHHMLISGTTSARIHEFLVNETNTVAEQFDENYTGMFGMTFAMEEAPDPTTEVGVPGAQEYVTQHVPEWVKKYGKNSAFFCTNDAHTEPLIKGLLENGGYFIEADLPSPIMGYPGALDLDLTEDNGDFTKITDEVEKAVVDAGGEGRFGTWTSSYGYTNSAGLAEHARNVIMGKSELTDLNAIREAYKIYTPETEWNGAKYTNAETGEAFDNIFLVYQDTYIFGDPGHYMGVTKVEVPEEYYSIR